MVFIVLSAQLIVHRLFPWQCSTLAESIHTVVDSLSPVEYKDVYVLTQILLHGQDMFVKYIM